jgi:hypothetical protein
VPRIQMLRRPFFNITVVIVPVDTADKVRTTDGSRLSDSVVIIVSPFKQSHGPQVYVSDRNCRAALHTSSPDSGKLESAGPLAAALNQSQLGKTRGRAHFKRRSVDETKH